MLAYSVKNLYNLAVHQQVDEAFIHQLITANKREEIKAAHTVDLYTPSYSITIGLGLLTFFIIAASLGLLGLITSFNSPEGILFVMAFACYGALEFIVSTKKHFNSGIDNVTMAAFVCLFTIFFILILPDKLQQPVWACACITLVTAYLALRFADSIMAVTAVVSFLLFLFYFFTTVVVSVTLFVPFILMVASAILYFVVTRLQTKPASIYYQHVLKMMCIATLVSLYCAGNVYVVSDALMPSTGKMVAVSYLNMFWFYWCWTFVLPLIYLATGIRRRNIVFTRLGVLLLACSVVTFFYYYPPSSPEVVMLAIGTVLILVTYGLIRYLNQAHAGFIFKPTYAEEQEKINVEGLVVGEVFGNQEPVQPTGTTFGGGSFGGAGSGGSY